MPLRLSATSGWTIDNRRWTQQYQENDIDIGSPQHGFGSFPRQQLGEPRRWNGGRVRYFGDDFATVYARAE